MCLYQLDLRMPDQQTLTEKSHFPKKEILVAHTQVGVTSQTCGLGDVTLLG